MIVLLVVVTVAVAAGAYYVYRHRPEPNIESGIRSFRREMRALAPPPGHLGRASVPDTRPEPDEDIDLRDPEPAEPAQREDELDA